MTPPIVRIEAVAFLGLLAGLTIATASGYGLLGSLLTGGITGILCGVAMVAVVALEAADRRAHRPVVREPQSHVRVEREAA